MAEIQEILADYLSKGVQDIKKEDFQNIKKEFYRLSKKIEEMNIELTFLYNTDRWYYFLNDTEMNDVTKEYIISKDEKNEKQRKIKEDQLLKQALLGYELFQMFREILTRQNIYYSIGALGKKSLVTGNFTYNQLKEGNFLAIEARSSGYTIRLKASQKKIKKESQKNKNFSNFEKFVEGRSTLFSEVYAFYKNERLDKNWKVGNKGNFYEVYRYLYLLHDRNNNFKPSTEEIKNAFSKILSNVGSQNSFAHGGDIGLQQDKLSNATFLDIQTLSNILLNTAKAIQESISLDNKEIILKQIINQRVSDKILEEATSFISKNLHIN